MYGWERTGEVTKEIWRVNIRVECERGEEMEKIRQET